LKKTAFRSSVQSVDLRNSQRIKRSNIGSYILDDGMKSKGDDFAEMDIMILLTSSGVTRESV